MDQLGPLYLRTFVESMRQGPAGVIADIRLLASPWELDWSAITVPVSVFQGDADLQVPTHQAEDIVGRLPAGTARLHILADVGHVSLVTKIDDILDNVCPPAAASG